MGCCASLGISREKKSYSNELYDIAMYATQNVRRKMEDTNTICLSIPNHPQYSFFAVFDGFNGDDASIFLSENMLNMLNNITDLENDDLIIDTINEMDKKWLNENKLNNAGSTLVFAIIKVTNPIDNDLLSPTPHSTTALSTNDSVSRLSIARLSTSNVTYSGIYNSIHNSMHNPIPSTSAIPMNSYHDFSCRVFWAGDSRAILIEKDYNFKCLTIDHNCLLETETQRIKKANGNIINNRIDGIVAVSRCFGCDLMKNNDKLDPKQQKMISKAECNHITCKPNDTLLIFCDGLISAKWSTKQLVENYKYNYKQHKNQKDSNLNSLTYLIEQVIDDGSTDNITVISVKFK